MKSVVASPQVKQCLSLAFSGTEQNFGASSALFLPEKQMPLISITSISMFEMAAVFPMAYRRSGNLGAAPEKDNPFSRAETWLRHRAEARVELGDSARRAQVGNIITRRELISAFGGVQPISLEPAVTGTASLSAPISGCVARLNTWMLCLWGHPAGKEGVAGLWN